MMTYLPRCFHPGSALDFDAVVISSRCKRRVQEISAARPAALIICSGVDLFARNGIAVAMARQERMFFLTVAGRQGGLASYDAIVDVLWGDDPEGGPDDTRRIIDVLAHRLRLAAALLGFKIETRIKEGYALRDVFAQRVEQVAA